MSQNSFPTSLGNTGSLQDFTANLEVAFSKGWNDWSSYNDTALQFYVKMDKGSHAGATFRVEEPLTALQMPSITDEGDNYSQNVIAPGYYKDVTVRRRTASSTFTWFFDYHNKYPEQLFKVYYETGQSLRMGLEVDCQQPFTFGTATSYTRFDGRTVDISTGDGLSLFNTAHTLTNSSTTYRNRVAGNPQISEASIEAAMTIGQQQIMDNNGNRRPTHFNSIVVGSDMAVYNLAQKIVKSISPREEANAGVFNPLQNALRVVRWIFLDSNANANTSVDTTKSNYWMLIDPSQLGAYVVITEQPTVTLPTISNGGIVFANDNRTVKASATYEVVMLDPRFVVFSSGDGVA